MSYCRFGEADIYVYGTMSAFECCGCPAGGRFSTPSAPAMIAHMLAHRAAGLEVPEDAILGVWQDRHDYRNKGIDKGT